MDSSWSDLFKEIGNTLKEEAASFIRAGVTTVRSSIAERAASTPMAQEYKMREIMKLLPYVAIGAVVLVLIGKYWSAR